MQTIKKIRNFSVAGVIITIILGYLDHYLYSWTGNNKIAGVFGAVNESTWEHLKIVFWPIMVFAIIEFFAYGYKQKSFFMGKALSAIVAMITIIVLFYTYTGIVGENLYVMNILIFILGIIFAYVFYTRFMKNYIDIQSNTLLISGIIAILLMAAAFAIFTFDPPKINLFLDPVTETYGIST